ALNFTPFRAVVDRSWQVTSFSRLTAGLHQEAFIADHDRTPDQENQEGAGGETAGPTIFDFPKGAGPGTFLHHLFEHLDFGAFRAGGDQEVAGWLAAQLGQFGFAGQWHEPVRRMLHEVVSVQLPGQTFCLADLGPEARLNELEFHLPLARSRAPQLVKLFGRHDHGGGAALIPQLERLDYGLVKGFLKGFVDLVFCHQGRYYIIDWKSNYLGPQSSDYGPAQLLDAMVAANYSLQYHLYTVALHRYLASRLDDYAYQHHFGGVFYIFLRGVRRGSESGIFFDRPEERLIADLADLLVQAPGQHEGGPS
nr:PD-(D/E)XK nuclease family protein [Deltaproteobacteria bacterium]